MGLLLTQATCLPRAGKGWTEASAHAAAVSPPLSLWGCWDREEEAWRFHLCPSVLHPGGAHPLLSQIMSQNLPGPPGCPGWAGSSSAQVRRTRYWYTLVKDTTEGEGCYKADITFLKSF